MAVSNAAKISALTALAMVAFAANSVLNRIALAEGEADALTYTGVRLASGALMLVLILVWRGARPGWGRMGGSTGGALALFLYAIAFSYAYLDLAAGTGALLLFAAVQLGMLGWAIGQGDRPGAFEWAGFSAAMLFLVFLVLPGVTAPDPFGAALMILAGLAWAAYTLIGRGSAAPLVDTGGNFLRCLPIAFLLILPGLFAQTTSLAGWLYAIASGALASGLGYAIWYSVLPALERSTAAYVQLSVPAIAAVGGVLFIAEPLTLRLVLCSLGILGGVALALWGADQRKRRAMQATSAA
ncbi:DMT family transporter [Rhodobacteraceae bacterium 2376]|uniref:DMT family transporter n=1 Tax=Rhabdonatronobacter sediminivivens TaxID=2743469 RepID=A0A7Z0I1S0_9RHOB|nr:DMT family transporter [Rhabdonatronobacter sediminivivens]NYS26367.1 DMT family transporter [Rhabdonatronobacter sediminivivens]